MSALATRRGVLMAFAATPLVAAVPAAAHTPSQFRLAVARLASASAAAHAYTANIYEPAYQARAEAAAKLEAALDAVPHVRTKSSFQNTLDGRTTLTTSEPGMADRARKMLADVPTYATENRDYLETLRELVAADEARAQRIAEIRTEHVLPDMPDDIDVLDDLEYDALQEAIACPVRDPAELLEKVVLMRRWDQFDIDRSVDALMRDVASLTGAA